MASACYLTYVNILNTCGWGEMPIIFKTENLFLVTCVFFQIPRIKADCSSKLMSYFYLKNMEHTHLTPQASLCTDTGVHYVEGRAKGQ